MGARIAVPPVDGEAFGVAVICVTGEALVVVVATLPVAVVVVVPTALVLVGAVAPDTVVDVPFPPPPHAATNMSVRQRTTSRRIAYPLSTTMVSHYPRLTRRRN